MSLDMLLDFVKWQETATAKNDDGSLFVTHKATLKIGNGLILHCFQLSNGQRLIDIECVMEFRGGDRKRFARKRDEIQRLITAGGIRVVRPSVFSTRGIEQEQADFEAGMLRLAALLPQSLAIVAESFRQWAGPNPLPWRVALDYCIDRARAGKSLPWEVSDGGWKGHHASQIIIDEADKFFQVVGDDVQLVGTLPERIITINEFTEEFRDVTQRAFDEVNNDEGTDERRGSN